MKRLLLIDACPRGSEVSRTYHLAQTFLEKYREKYPDTVTDTFKIDEHSVYPITKSTLEKRNNYIEAEQFDIPMFEAARQFASADIIVVAASYWDLSFPSMLKMYIEDIMVNQITFCYTKTGMQGMCRASELYYITTAGGYIGENNLGYEYIRKIAQSLGIPKTSFLSAEGLDIIGNDPKQILESVQFPIA